MERITYIYVYDKIKEQAWSGTPFGLYNQLVKHYHVEEIALRYPLICRVVRRTPFLSKFLSLVEFHYFRTVVKWRMMSKKHKSNSIIFQYTDFVEESPNRKTYIYQDMSVGFLLSLAKSRKGKDFCFGEMDANVLQARSMYEKEYYKKCSAIFTMGNWIRQFMIDHQNIDPKKIFTIGGGINLSPQQISPSKTKTGNKILFVGRDYYRKGGDLVYEAFCVLKNKKTDLELYIAGPSVDPNPNNQVSGYHYLGDADKNTLAKYYNEADIFCMPSRFEAYGLVFIEALSFGLPCIGRNICEMPYLIENGVTGLLLEKEEVQSLCELIENLLSNEEIKQNVAQKRNWYLSEYSWENVSNKIHNVIRNGG